MIFGKKNILKEQWEKRYESLPSNIQESLDELLMRESFSNELIPIKSDKAEVKTGDLIVVQPLKGVFFVGQVINAKIQHVDKNHSLNGCHVVTIFKQSINDLNKLPDKINKEPLFSPKIVSPDCWTKGYIVSIGNDISLLNNNEIDYGFYDIVFGRYMTETGVVKENSFQLLSSYSISTYASLGLEIHKELIIEQNLR